MSKEQQKPVPTSDQQQQNPDAGVSSESNPQEQGPSKVNEKAIRELTDVDYELLREHIRVVKGMKVTVMEESKKKKLDIEKSPLVGIKPTRASEMRKKYNRKKIKKGKKLRRGNAELEDLKKLAEKYKQEPYQKIKMNKAAKVRWMSIRNMPVFSDDFKESFDTYGRPVFRVPMKYVPFNMLWEADWIKNPYVWQDEQ